MFNITRDTGEFLLVLLSATHARDVLEVEESSSKSFDAVFLDCERSQYAKWWPSLSRVLRPGGLMVVDNAVSHASELAPLVTAVKADRRFVSCLLPIGKGEFMTVKSDH